VPYGRSVCSFRALSTRGIARSIAAGAVLATAVTLAPMPATADPGPSIDDVQVRVDRLYHDAETAAERYNTGRERLSVAQRELRTLRADLAAQERLVASLRDQLGAMVAAQAQNSPLSTATELLASENATTFLAGIAAVQSYNEHQAVQVGSYEEEADELAGQREAMTAQVARVAEDVQRLREVKRELDAKAGRAEDLLASLKAERRERVEARMAAAEAAAAAAAEAEQAETAAALESESAPESSGATASESESAPEGSSPTDGAAPESGQPASGSASSAVDFALAQVGDAYVYGAAGPSAWDCSGLTMAAWGAAGVSLPHSSTMQSSMGTAVSVSDLQPGDLVFYYSPVSHVGMYIGNGQLVHAANPSSPVEVVSVTSMPITTARRVG
jgi:cell wall-associated NlpC family hydrolase